MLTIYKASAGSGKTFHLVVEYLKLLMQNPFNYKHILAVTFTNKATNEMKSRILEQLHLLAEGEESKYLETLQNELNFKEENIRQKSRLVLKNILHDYNRFSINTIDSFTQRVIKAFNRELGISPNFALELDDSLVLEEAVDQMLSKIDQDKKLLDWLVKFSEEKITENQSQRIEEDIKALGKELFNEKFQLFFPDTKDSATYTRENLDAFKKELGKIIAVFESTLQKKGYEAISSIENHGFSVDDFSYKRTGVAGYFLNLSEGKIKEPGARILTAEESSEKWFAKSHKQKAELQALVESKLQPLLSDILDFFRKQSIPYYSAVAVNNQLRMLGILTDLKEEIRKLLQEKGMLQLSDSNLLLNKIIGESDSPFIYEKVGNFFKYFMLDEFQDTSSLQWRNFKPLISNSLSEGNKNLLVGDVKQSIYRWRNSDWNILAEQVDTDFPAFIPETKALTKNWRSDKNIIAFNNSSIEHLKSALETNLFSGSDDKEWEILKEKFTHIYSDFKQEPGNTSVENKGFVQVNFLEEDEFQENSTQLLIEQVKKLQDNGFKASDISILIRTNKEGTQIIEEFLSAAKQQENTKYNLSVLSNESLFLHASRSVLFVMLMIEWLIDPENKITQASLLQLWESSIKPELARKGISFSVAQQTLDFSGKDKENWQLENDFDAAFGQELGSRLQEMQQKVLLTSLDETLTEICSHFQLFKLESELPFLQTLIDKAGEIKTSIANDLSNFLYWWNEKGFRTSVNVNDEIDSIRLITVHKSKGLEFKAVLIPYLNWKTSWSGNFAPTLWCSTETEPFNRFPLLPVKATSGLENTLFKKDYFEEKANTFIDTMNLIYVAFTRAESVLMINSINVQKTGKSVNGLFKESLQMMSSKAPFEDCWNEDETIFEFGELHPIQQEEKESNLVLIKNYEFNKFRDKIKLRLNGEDFLVPGKENKSVKNRGKIIHEILSAVQTKNDLETACKQALLEGRIDEDERISIQQELLENIDKPEVKHWFDGSWKILNERDLLTSVKILRPDRIMFSGKTAIVVDYKTGEQKQDKYKTQVKRYAKTLKETGFEKVEGFLWYVALNEVEKVGEF
ncbi:UvrD-helicase domain-containing protein [Maribellus maritimus]|uniref:UvrD-helicase domain-containing protein n=1 Tax=Maribellus maritimus TaxID=2870838 RepID=UPI001EEB4338|nr:UvrD-helicase domain-containing protein [Maribellus maritimus]MCG6187655.1 UvrD-helicase domain-containing protein [Maribellus maritimus]